MEHSRPVLGTLQHCQKLWRAAIRETSCRLRPQSPPTGSLVNSGIPKNSYLNLSTYLFQASVQPAISSLNWKDQGCHIFKRDLSRAYQHLWIDTWDYHLLGYQHQNELFIDIARLSGSGPQLWYESAPPTPFVSSCVSTAPTTISVLNTCVSLTRLSKPSNVYFQSLGLESSRDKDCSLSTHMTFLVVLLDAITI